jgi:thiol-disulfide isomerase/thioredoxin
MDGKHKRYSRFFALAIVATVLLTACGTALQSNPEGGAATADVDTPEAADFQITVYDGQEVVGGDEVSFSEVLALGKPVVLNLWAGLCPPCRLEMPEFQEVSQQFGDEIILLGLDVGPFTNLGTSEDGKALVQELGITYPTGTTGSAEVVGAYRLLGMPTTYFITPDGQIVRQWTGLLTESKLAELVDKLVNVSQSG